MPSFLYVMPSCKHCDDAKVYLQGKGEEFVEIPFNPFTNMGIQQAIGRVIFPLLLRDEGPFFWVETEPGVKKFVKILS